MQKKEGINLSMERKIVPAICCLGYNRPESMRRLLKSLANAKYDQKNIPLIISIDECELSEKVAEVAERFEWKYGEKIIRRFKERQGTIKHTLQCGDLSLKYGAVVYLEDDIVVAPGFYMYLEAALNKYSEIENVLGIALYSLRWNFPAKCEFVPQYIGSDVYRFNGDISWGQCWLDHGWKKFRAWLSSGVYEQNMYNPKVSLDIYNWSYESSWSRAISFFMAECNMCYIVPYISLSTCMADKGVHTSAASDICQVPISQKLDKNYCFFDFDNLIEYDQFYEQKIAIDGIKNICVDLNGLKYDYSGCDYLLSTKLKRLPVIKSYSNSLEPIELNVNWDMVGNKIFLYKLPNKNCKEDKMIRQKNYTLKENNSVERILYRLSMKDLIYYIKRRIKRRLLK